MKIGLNITEDLEKSFEGKNVTSWNGVIELQLDKLGIPKIGDAYILINETITEKFNTT